MKRIHLLSLILMSLVLVLAFAACAYAAEIVPLPVDPDSIDLDNGTFRLEIRDADRIAEGGYFTAVLYLPETYDGEQVRNMVPGDTVQIEGRTWTVREVQVHDDPITGAVAYEIFPVEGYDNYLVFQPTEDGNYNSATDDYNPIVFVAEKKIMLPLPDAFSFLWEDYSGEAEPVGMDGFISQFMEFGGFNAYNTVCTFKDGLLVSIEHADYPSGPQADEEDETEEEADAAAEAEGFEPVPLWQFCHGKREGLEDAVIKGFKTDCEEGPIEYEMTPEEVEEMRSLAINGIITGKANDMSLTGNTWLYSFESPDGEYLLGIEMYKGLIVSADGMYSYGY